MNQPFKSSEVRKHAELMRHSQYNLDSHTPTMLDAYADRLEADEKAVPVAWQVCLLNGDWEPTRDPDFHRSTGRAVRPLYTHPAPADAERFNSLLTGTTPGGVHYGLHGSKESVEAVSDMIANAKQPKHRRFY